MRAWKEGLNFRELVMDDPAVKRVPPEALARAFDVRHQLRHVDAIFARVFGSAKP
jgi:hypothetical protein